MTLSLGLASVFMINGSLYNPDEIKVNLPQVQSEEVFFIVTKKSICIPAGGMYARYPEETEKKIKAECFEKSLMELEDEN